MSNSTFRSLINLVTVLPIVAACGFALGMWQTSGALLSRTGGAGDVSLSGLFSVSAAAAQSADSCGDPDVATAGEGRIYFNKCRDSFRISHSASTWEDLGGGFWKAYAAPNQDDIYNTNAGHLYFAGEALFGLNGVIGGTISDSVVSLDDVTKNLIYGAASLDSAVDKDNNLAASLLKLQTFNVTNIITPYKDVFSVRVDGKVIIASGGRLVVPEICLPDETSSDNCITSFTGGGGPGGEAAADKFWKPLTADSQDTITNNNVYKNNGKAGGNVLVTRDLTTIGSVYIKRNNVNTDAWSTLNTGKIGDSDVKGIFFDIRNSSSMSWNYDTKYGIAYAGTNFTEYSSGGLVLMALSDTKINRGKVAVYRSHDYVYSKIPEFKQTNPTGGTSILQVVDDSGIPASGLNAVCSVGDPDTATPKNYKIFAVGQKGEIWIYQSVMSGATYVKHRWVRLAITVPSTVEWKDVDCKQDDANADIYEMYAVGTQQTILEYNGTGFSWLSGPGAVGTPAVNGVWLQNRHETAPINPSDVNNGPKPWLVLARYYAVGEGGKIYYWKSHAKTPAELYTWSTGTSSDTFYAVGGQIKTCSTREETCVDPTDGRYVYFGGAAGLVYRANMTNAIGSITFVKLEGATSTMYDIIGITGNSFHVYAALKDNASYPRSGAQDSFFKYTSVANLALTPLASRVIDSWTPINDLTGTKFISFDGYGYSRTGNTPTSQSWSGVRMMLGAKGATAFYQKDFQFKTEEGIWKPNLVTPFQTMLQGEAVNLLSTWRPTTVNAAGGLNGGFSDESAFIGGEKGVIFKSGDAAQTITPPDPVLYSGLDIAGLAGYYLGATDIPYKVYAVGRGAAQSYVLSYIGNDKFIKVNTTAYNFKLNDIWASDDTANPAMVAVGNNGNIVYCVNLCDTATNWKTFTYGTADLLKVSGYRGTLFMVTSQGKAVRCTTSGSGINRNPLNGCSTAVDNIGSARAIWVNTQTTPMEVWAAGDSGHIFHNANIAANNWPNYPDPVIPGITLSNYDFNAITGVGPLVFIAGTNSTILKFDGVKWDFNSIGSTGNLSVYAMAGNSGPSPTDATITTGKAWAVGNGVLGGRYYELGGSLKSGDLVVDNNAWGTPSAAGSGVQVTTGTVATPIATFVPIPPSGQTNGTNACPPGEFVVGFDVDKNNLITKFHCRKL